MTQSWTSADKKGPSENWNMFRSQRVGEKYAQIGSTGTRVFDRPLRDVSLWFDRRLLSARRCFAAESWSTTVPARRSRSPSHLYRVLRCRALEGLFTETSALTPLGLLVPLRQSVTHFSTYPTMRVHSRI